MNDFEYVINDLEMLKDNAHEFYQRNISDYSISYTRLVKILENALYLLKEYNNDIMKLIDIKDVCFKNQCIYCPLYVEDESECILENAPLKWDLEEIERRLEKYGKEKSTN